MVSLRRGSARLFVTCKAVTVNVSPFRALPGNGIMECPQRCIFILRGCVSPTYCLPLTTSASVMQPLGYKFALHIVCILLTLESICTKAISCVLQ